MLNIAGLSPILIDYGPEVLPVLHGLISSGFYSPLEPVFPAVTCPVQASLTTGVYPSGHGVVSNGFFNRKTKEVHFWHQSCYLLEAQRFWTQLRQRYPGLRVAILFWQNTKYVDADIILTPAPIHTEEAHTIYSCYTKPRELDAELERRFDTFPLHLYWGPFASPGASRWIVNATIFVMQEFRPHLLFTYLPHLDYTLQRFGLKGDEVIHDLRILDGFVGELRDAAKRIGMEIVVLSEYGMNEVKGALAINQALRDAGLVSVREVRGREYLELGDSMAFAMVDHQIAHVYLKEGTIKKEVVAVAHDLDKGIEILSEEDQKRGYHVNHPNSGEVILIAPEDRWFNYWWWGAQKAPTFAHKVDIHRKPGYDPLELFLSPSRDGINLDMGLVRCSHGRPPTTFAQYGVFISSVPITYNSVKAVEVPQIIVSLIR
jgi:predicted AlkP superfamily pyrophosphatase or phosphodiesterase